MKKVLFICHANVGRSQMAEAFFNNLSTKDIAISAGVDSVSPEKYKHPTQKIIDVMREDGIDVSDMKVKFLTKEMFENSNVVYVLCKKELCPEYIKGSEKVMYHFLKDPYQMNEYETRRIRDEIKEFVLSII